ncbi:hypothetical protein HML84_11785 [Alcanivorax sp. IO_7]|nr:hypothetical protein HML84_11785 [Alcanivorax sp. IO_7]
MNLRRPLSSLFSLNALVWLAMLTGLAALLCFATAGWLALAPGWARPWPACSPASACWWWRCCWGWACGGWPRARRNRNRRRHRRWKPGWRTACAR